MYYEIDACESNLVYWFAVIEQNYQCKRVSHIQGCHVTKKQLCQILWIEQVAHSHSQSTYDHALWSAQLLLRLQTFPAPARTFQVS